MFPAPVAFRSRSRSRLALVIAAALTAALAVVVPAGSASADPQCPQFIIEPTIDCPGYSPDPVPSDESMWMPTMTDPAPAPVAADTPIGGWDGLPPGTRCNQTSRWSLIYATDRVPPAYIFRVGAEYCIAAGRIVRLTPMVPAPEVLDSRVSPFFGPRPSNVTIVPSGTSVGSVNVFYGLDVNFYPNGFAGEIQTYHHEFGFRIVAQPFDIVTPPPVFQLTRRTV